MGDITRLTPLGDLPELLRVDEAATWADVSKGTIYEAIKAGELPCVKLGRLVRVPRAALARMVQGGDHAGR